MSDNKRSWDLKNLILQNIKANGGWVNAHAHFDRAFTITPENLQTSRRSLKDKWHLLDEIKRTSTTDQIYDRMAAATELMISQKVQAYGTFIDVDEITKDKAIKAAQKIREKYGKQIKIKFINQVLKGVLDKKARQWFDIAAEFADIIGGLPKKDAPREAEHIDYLMTTAKKMGKRVHVHVDQFNSPTEKETELLVDKTIEHGMQGKVAAVHGISIAAHPQDYRNMLYQKIKDAGVTLIVCPTAVIDTKRSEEKAVTHNSIAPVEEMVEAGVDVALGTDNIADLIKPFTDGDIWTELRFLLETCRLYDIDALVKIATVNGRQVLGI